MPAGPFQNLPEVPPADKTAAVLAVSSSDEDHINLARIFRDSNWVIHVARSCREAVNVLRRRELAVLLCEGSLPDGTWKDVLREISLLPVPPFLIVASRCADDALWGEALNLGAYDVLAKPFDRAEVTRIVSLAWLHWKEGRSRAKKGQAGASGSGGHGLSAMRATA